MQNGKCPHLSRRELGAYLDGISDFERRKATRIHLAACNLCRERLNFVRCEVERLRKS